ncbi:hypothetical protein [Flavobacterium litorale]|uniref:Uncharacterized protein n=1 Tax=Flavobacterium litorale TaxID=2856519 RepID=A0ABX8V7R7_9FLAO|nr:hypothetical protein [Flavobacterium litorale]QYJ68870.1 hypothetical protein K1I41_03020 [Flavobacterium litorale]
MKQFTLPALLCVLLLSLFSCSSDNDEAPTAYQQKSGTTNNVIYKKLEKHNYPNPALIDEELARAKQSIAASSLAGLDIKDEDALYAEYNGKHTLTFVTDRANSKDNETENIVLESNPDGSYNKYHFKYLFTQRELSNLHQLPTETILANTQVTPLLAGNGAGLININCFNVTQNYEFQWQCEAGNPHGPGHPDCQVGGSDIVLQPTTLTYTYIGCDEGGSGNGGSGGDTGGGNTGGGGSGDGGGNTGGGTGGSGNDGGTGGGEPDANYGLIQGQTLITQPLVVANPSNQFFFGLKPEQQQWATANQGAYDAIVDYLTNENWSNESKQFAENWINLLKEIETNPTALLGKSDLDLQPWFDLMNYTIPTSVVNKIEQLDNDNFGDYAIQRVKDGKGAVVNMDFFSVNISTLPINSVTGTTFTPKEFLNHIRLNINDFLDTSISSFSPSTITGYNENQIWNSSNPLKAIIHINIAPPAGDGSVICSKSEDDSWIFTTIEVPWFPGQGNDGIHPVSGNREFGLIENNDGSYTFYTRGMDRMTDSLESLFAENTTITGSAFDAPDALWGSLRSGVYQFVENNSGTAEDPSMTPPITFRPAWSQVRRVLIGEIPMSELCCN